MILADTLSCAYVNTNSDSENLEEDLACAVNLVVNNLPVSDPKLEEFRSATEQDSTTPILRNIIKSG